MNNWNLMWDDRMHSSACSSGAQCLPQQSEWRIIIALDSVSHELWVIPLPGHKLDVVVISAFIFPVYNMLLCVEKHMFFTALRTVVFYTCINQIFSTAKSFRKAFRHLAKMNCWRDFASFSPYCYANSPQKEAQAREERSCKGILSL